jgi:serine/threonine protein kinase/tetratricopeptide (TPR) repeat protein
MGEVYEAEDFVLKENIAIKCMLAQIAGDEHFRVRFRREVMLARKVTHPNVCRIFEVYSDTPSSPGGGTSPATPPFMTMELLRGETLAEFLQEKNGTDANTRQGTKKRQLTLEEALPLLSQMLAALGAAHKVDVVHRDFKCSNVFLATKAGTKETRVVVTDFGLARLAEVEGQGTYSFTGESELVGTAPYMAPEQVEGGEITPATDIYALGVVMYEMATGTWPFLGKTANETAHLRLKTKPKAPIEIVPTLHATWNAVILKCLERAPADRFRTVEEVSDALTGETAALRRRTREQREKLLNRLKAFAVVALVLAVAAVAYRWRPRAGQEPSGQPISIAVVRFQNLSQNPEKNWIGTSLEDVLTRELAASDGFRVTPAADVLRMRQELGVQTGGDLDQPALERVRNDLGVDRLILGDYQLSGPPSNSQIRVILRVFDSAQGSEPFTATENGLESDIFSLSDHIARDLRARFHVGDLSAAARAQVQAALPSTAASRAYFDGLQKLGQFDPLAARDFLQEAVTNSPEAPLAHFALSQAWDILGYDQKALEQARSAQALSSKLSVPEQRSIECRVLELERRDWDGAISRCRGLWVFRKDLQNGLRLAAVQFSAERGNDALETITNLRKELPAPDKDDPKIDLAEAETRDMLTQYGQMETAAEAARQKAEKKEARLLQASALFWLCAAQQNQDKLSEAVKSCTTGGDLYSTVGDKIGQARTDTNLAHALTKSGDSKGAAEKYAEALALAKSVGSKRDECDALLNYGDAFYDQNKLEDAIQKYNSSLAVAKESGYRVCQAHAVENLGSIARDKHEFPLAAKSFEQAQNLYSELSMSADLARLQSNLGDLLWQQGDPSGARVRLEDAADRRRQLGLRDGLGLTLTDLGDVLLAQDAVDKALASYREAMSIKQEVHQDKEAVILQIYIAQAQVEKGEFADAEASARKLAGWFSAKENKDADIEVFARDVLIRSLLSQKNRGEDAVKEAKALQDSLRGAADEETILSARVTMARAYAAQRSFPRALTELRAVLAEAHKRSFVTQEFNANLSLLEAAKLQGTSAKSDRSSIAEFARKASAKGYLLFERKALALLGGG